MSDERDDEGQGEVSCHVCHREVPHADALSVEGQEYLFFFCGQGCYVNWKQDHPGAQRKHPR